MTIKQRFRALLVCLVVAAAPAAAQEPPSVVARDAMGATTVRAVKLSQPLHIDGRLDEALYRDVAPMSDFLQMEPTPGAPTTEKTELWISFDQNNLYVSVRCFNSQPESRWVLDEMRRDSGNIPRNENVAFFFDTFFDHRSAFLFEITPLGAIYDAQAGNLKPGSADWNPIWVQKTGRFEGGWTAEMAFPFKSLRYNPGSTQVWGFNMRRTVRWKNEQAYLRQLPLISGFSGDAAIFQIANGAKLVGIEAPSGSKNLEIKPYAVGSVSTDRQARPAISNDPNGDVGLDVKYGLTQNLTADLTYNTDFAQVEVDTAQVNLTRFNLFFPEKREFFLEGQNIFDFGGASSGGAGAGGTTPLLFFSRRIGLNGSRAVPIQGGGRLTGRAGAFTLGMLDVRSDRDKTVGTRQTNFSVVRIKRDVLKRSSIGLLYTGRSVSSVAPSSAQTYGVDGSFNLRNFLNINTYFARTDTPTLKGDDTSYRLQASYNLDRYGVEFDRLAVGNHFRPDVGYLQRDDFHRTYALGRFSPRPEHARVVRKYTYQTLVDYFSDGRGVMQSRDVSPLFSAEFQNGNKITAQAHRNFERLVRPFAISRGVVIPVGAYDFGSGLVQVSLGNQRRISGTVTLERGTFYSGDKTTLSYSGGRTKFSPRVSMEPGVSLNWVDLREGSFTTSVLTDRVTFTVTPRMFVSGLVQYASATRTVGSNLRFRWEYQPGSELFLVYTDERDTTGPHFPDLKNRAFVLKINRLVRF